MRGVQRAGRPPLIAWQWRTAEERSDIGAHQTQCRNHKRDQVNEKRRHGDIGERSSLSKDFGQKPFEAKWLLRVEHREFTLGENDFSLPRLLKLFLSYVDETLLVGQRIEDRHLLSCSSVFRRDLPQSHQDYVIAV